MPALRTPSRVQTDRYLQPSGHRHHSEGFKSFAQTMEEEDERFYATFPAAKPPPSHHSSHNSHNPWVFDQRHDAGQFQGEFGFYYSTTSNRQSGLSRAYPTPTLDLIDTTLSPTPGSSFDSTLSPLSGALPRNHHNYDLVNHVTPTFGELAFGQPPQSPCESPIDYYSHGSPLHQHYEVSPHSSILQLVKLICPKSPVHDGADLEVVLSPTSVRSQQPLQQPVPFRQQQLPLSVNPYTTTQVPEPLMDFLPSPETVYSPMDALYPTLASNSLPATSPPPPSSSTLPLHATSQIQPLPDFSFMAQGQRTDATIHDFRTSVAKEPSLSSSHSHRRDRLRSHSHTVTRPSPRTYIYKIPMKQISSSPPPSAAKQSTPQPQKLQKGTPQDKKPPLACYFCRGRKIACGPADPENPDKSCK